MPFDLDRAYALLSGRAPTGLPVSGAPDRDLDRSPAARQVGDLAAAAGLRLFHFEQRVELELPLDWIAPGQEELAEPPDWNDGALPEPKYQSFRHDLYLGSFHPGHRGKWTTHELCHGLVGTAWRPDASPLFHATAARLAELLPVVLYYFLDEFGLARCEAHAGDGALFRTFCRACEEATGGGWDREQMQVRWLQEARDFLDRELAAIARTRRLGRPVPHRWATLDLTSDGLAYARSHGPRLDSPAFARWADRFQVGFRSLDALEARVIEVLRALCEGEPLHPQPGDPITQDLGWRLLQVAAQCEGEARRAVEGMVDSLADGAAIHEVIDRYRAAEEAWFLPEAERVFAVGYDLQGTELGRSTGQIRRGLQSVVPLTLELLEDAGVDRVAAFVAQDSPRRRPLGERFAGWLCARGEGRVGELAAYEVALRVARSDGVADTLGPGDPEAGWRLGQGAVALEAPWDLSLLAERVDSGEVRGVVRDKRVELEGRLPAEGPVGLLIGRDQHGDAVVVEIPAEVAGALAAGAPDALEPLEEEARVTLNALGLVAPTKWTWGRSGAPRDPREG